MGYIVDWQICFGKLVEVCVNALNSCLDKSAQQQPDKYFVFTQLIHGRYRDQYDEHYVIDCRFPYEYEVGDQRTPLEPELV
jgi:hypothetical protein